MKPIYLNIKNENIEIYLHHQNSVKENYMRYCLQHCKKPYICSDFEGYQNQDLWRLYSLYDYRLQDGDVPEAYTDYELVNAGEWECAIKIKNTDDFHGGLHGTERYKAIQCAVDSNPLNVFEDYSSWADKLEFYQQSEIYLQGTYDTVIAIHHKWYDFSKYGVTIRQSLEWKGAYTIEKAYLAMLPVKRESETGLSISDHAKIGESDKIYDVSKEGHELNGNNVIKNIKSAHIWGEKSGLYAHVEFLSELMATNSFYIQNNAMYNKIYFSYCGDGYTTYAGETWETCSHYDIYRTKDYNNLLHF